MKRSLLSVVIALSLVPAIPAVAKKHRSAAKSQSLGYAYEPAPSRDNNSRTEAIEKCNVEAAKWRYSDWQTAQITNYRDCMTQHGQPFE